MRISKVIIRKFCKEYGIDTNVLPIETIQKGMKAELEHGTKAGVFDVTHDDMLKTFKISIQHLKEGINYYTELDKMEKKLKKVNIYL
jgi:hypothetical protein